MYTVIYSTDPYLLARMATDLQMGGWLVRNGYWNPFDINFKYLTIDDSPGTFNFINHRGIPRPIRHTLTSRNYLKVLRAIVNSKK